MNIRSTEVLQALAAKEGRYLLFEIGVPFSALKGNVITLREANDSEVVFVDDQRRHFTANIPRAMFDDFVRASLIAQDGDDDRGHKLRFALTNDGRERGKQRS